MKNNRFFLILVIIFFLFSNCSFDSKTGIWTGEEKKRAKQLEKEIKENSEEVLKADLIIEALGFEPEDLPVMFNEPALNVTQWGTLKVDYKNLMTSLDGVFAAGDIVRGASLVVWGIKDGRDAAGHIHNYLSKNMKETKSAVNE